MRARNNIGPILFALYPLLIFAGLQFMDPRSVGLLVLIRRRVFGSPQLDNGIVPGRSLAYASLVCWFGAIVAGRLEARRIGNVTVVDRSAVRRFRERRERATA